MTTAQTLPPPSLSPLRREVYLAIVAAALQPLAGAEPGSLLRFTRQAILNWLAAYPGDLKAGLLYAQVLIAEGRPQHAQPVLEGLCQADPEYLEAQELLANLRAASGKRDSSAEQAAVQALGGRLADGIAAAPWGRYLWVARRALQEGSGDQAEEMIRLALANDPPSPLAAVIHLRFLASHPNVPLAARRSLAELYHQRWPDCLQCSLFLADYLMDGGDSEGAVRLLHQVAARDVAAQAAARLWPHGHPYRPIWPSELALSLEIPIPAAVMAAMGWNRLAAGLVNPDAIPLPSTAAYSSPVKPAVKMPSPPTKPVSLQVDPFPEVEIDLASPQASNQDNYPTSVSPFISTAEEEPLASLEGILPGEAPTITNKAIAHAEQLPHPVPATMGSKSEILRAVQDELDQMASRLSQPGPSRQDGRFPVYIVFSVRANLEKVYGLDGAQKIEAEMKALVQTIQKRRGLQFRWGARLFCPDDPACVTQLGLKISKPDDAWALKLAIADLDTALAKQGQMIGSLLIVGGPEVVPFHLLPNPIDDQDQDVPSDNPYASRDENYFIPEWPVGRLPGGAGNDPTLLISTLQRMIADHNRRGQNEAWYRLLVRKLISMMLNTGRVRASFGYTAAIWREASLAVFKPIGRPAAMQISPPFGVDGSSPNARQTFTVPPARLGYFNLHGVEDGPEWFGQRDPAGPGGVDYPVALRPEDIESQSRRGMPEVVFSEACYGLHIQGRELDQAISLKLLEAGSSAVVGSTCMAYGSISTPLIAADLLGHAFWQCLREGLPAGEALRRAKIHLAREMHRRQGYLDGEDQKTLISFVLYGDPLALPDGGRLKAHSIFRTVKPPATVKTVCDRATEPSEAPSEEVLAHVKGVVAHYLPGMADANLTITHEHAACSDPHHICPTSQMQGKNRPTHTPERSLVTLSKRVFTARHEHLQVARLTLDSQGNLVKLVVSR